MPYTKSFLFPIYHFLVRYLAQYNPQIGMIILGHIIVSLAILVSPIRNVHAKIDKHQQPESTISPGCMIMRITASEALYLRNGPDRNEKIIASMPRNARAMAVSAPVSIDDTHWYPLDYNGKLGWASGKYLEPTGEYDSDCTTDTPPEEPKTQPTQTATSTILPTPNTEFPLDLWMIGMVCLGGLGLWFVIALLSQIFSFIGYLSEHPAVRLTEIIGLIVTTAIAVQSCIGIWYHQPAPVLQSITIPWVMYMYTINSIITYIIFRLDKNLAQSGAWRVEEVRLHWMELAGGWPGVWIGMHLWSKDTSKRHKYNKIEYWLFTLLITLAHLAIWILFLIEKFPLR